MNDKFRCHCPITSALDILGDKWTLVIVKQMLIEGKQAFKDFFESDEGIASNILSARLKMLEQFKIIRKDKLPDNKKTNIYRLTDKGIALAPVLVELGVWSDTYMRDFHPEIIKDERMDALRNNKEAFVIHLQRKYEKESCLP